MRWGRRLLSTLLAAGACLPASAIGTPTVSMHAAFHPEIPGHATTVDFHLRIAPTDELVPPPLLEANLSFPAGLDVTLSGLGIDTCSIATLEAAGPQGCPPNSLMGVGRATAEFPVKHAVFREAAQIAIVRTTEQEGHLAMLFCIYGETAVDAQIILTSQLLPAPAPYGGRLNIHVPLVASLPEAPDVAVGEIKLVLGPQDLTYYERIHNRNIAYKPTGIKLPKHCPRGGFPFAVELRFQGGSRASSTTAVPCSPRSKRRG